MVANENQVYNALKFNYLQSNSVIFKALQTTLKEYCKMLDFIFCQQSVQGKVYVLNKFFTHEPKINK